MAKQTSSIIKNTERSSRAHRARAQAKQHYYRVMPNKKHHRVLIWSVFFSYAVVVAVQMLYPLDRALPLATAFGQNIAWQTDTQLAKRFSDIGQSAQLKLVAGDKRIVESLGKAGAEMRIDAMIHQVTDYPFWQRFVPFSILWQPVELSQMNVGYNDAVLGDFIARAATRLETKPVNARLSIKDGELDVVPDIPGKKVVAEGLRTAIKRAAIRPGASTVIVPLANVSADTTEKDFASIKIAAETALGRAVEISIEDRIFKPKQKTVASWLVIGAKKGKPVLTFDTRQFNKYLDTIDAEIGRKAGVTHVTITNGRETSRRPGEVGRAVDRSPLASNVAAWVLEGELVLPLMTELHDVAPSTVYNSKYTASEEGLRAYVKDISKQMDVHVAIRQIDGQGWTAQARANDSIPSASTYKLYVAKWVFREMEAGRLGWSSLVLGTTVSDCFDQMTIASTNACSQEWLRQFGRTNMNKYVWGLGFSRGTTFTHPEATHTTANDLMRFMAMLNNGSILSGAHRDRLLHSLSVHPYRSGIPAGSKGRVWDKVGFLWDYVHDAAIVKHPRGTYVMVVMTKGQSYGRIAEITRQVERIMYP